MTRSQVCYTVLNYAITLVKREPRGCLWKNREVVGSRLVHSNVSHGAYSVTLFLPLASPPHGS